MSGAIASVDLARWRTGGAAAAAVRREVGESLRRADFLRVRLDAITLT
ncbi:hypothetical protein [Nocardia sp. MH4]|nr:hypothetical protein [Nocardia sp. MH4]